MATVKPGGGHVVDDVRGSYDTELSAGLGGLGVVAHHDVGLDAAALRVAGIAATPRLEMTR